MNMSSTQIWLIIGIVLTILEIVSTTFVVLFFGIAGLVTALVSFLGVDSVTLQMLIFAVVSVGGLILFRSKLSAAVHKGGVGDYNSLVNKTIILDVDVPAKGRAAIMHMGTTWTAMNEGNVPLLAGESAQIVRLEGVKLVVAKPV